MTQRSTGYRRTLTFVAVLALAALWAFDGSVLSQSQMVPPKPQPIIIGAVVSLTGRDAAFGQECVAGLRLAIAEANAQGGSLDRLLELQVYDDQSNPIEAAKGVRTLVQKHHPVAIVGSNTSMVTSAAAVAAQEVGVPLIVPEATNPAITSIGNWIYRVCFVDPEMGGGLASFAYSQLGLRKVAILQEEKHDYTLSLARQFAKRFAELGGEIVYRSEYGADETDFANDLKEIRKRQADAVFVSGFFREAGAVLKEAHAQKLSLTFLGGDGWESDELFEAAGDAIDINSRIYIASHFSPDVKRSKVRGFVANFTEREGRRPNTSSALGFDAGGVVIEAITQSQAPVPEGVRAALLGVYHEGVTGRIDIDSTRNTTKKVIILQARPNRQFAFVKSVLGMTSGGTGSHP
ncbi:MAG TPA: ABC transporter substrate-binding protein [Acidobacteriota bacterium]|nr:ABC transporter substrate-binding protein [Acidobacteriota bacterium]